MLAMTSTESALLSIAALTLPGIGPSKVRAWQREAGPTGKLELRAAFKNLTSSELDVAMRRAEETLEQCEKLGIQAFSLWDPEYPDLLRRISDPPPVLYVKGNAEAIHLPCFAVVGTRKASERGRRAAELLAESLVTQGICVVSGLALGIDAAAHTGALRAKGKTVAILAHGLHTIQPSTNRKLGLQILDSDGALVSEHPPGVPPRPPEFVKRNRIQSGISMGSIIVESAEEGGAMHQARFTLTQKRIVAVALPRPLAENDTFNYAGGRLLRDQLGAYPVENAGQLAEIIEKHAKYVLLSPDDGLRDRQQGAL